MASDLTATGSGVDNFITATASVRRSGGPAAENKKAGKYTDLQAFPITFLQK